MLCPCGSSLTFSLCCQPIINLDQAAATPEQLMRSRYSAYATGNADYIYQTYAQSSQLQQSVDEIAQWAAMTKWLFLEIHHSSDPSTGRADENRQAKTQHEQLPEVKFSAFYLLGNKYHSMTETSRFIRENGLSRYLDGDVNEQDEAVREIKRNDLCPCRSKKKFKQCCGR